MIYKEPLNVEVVLQLIEQVLDNVQGHLSKAQNYDKEYGFEVIEFQKVKEIIQFYKTKKLLYAKEINGKVYYNYDYKISINLDNNFNLYEVISLSVAVLLTQNRAVIYTFNENKSCSFNMIITLLKKFATSLNLYDEYIQIKKTNDKLKKYDFNLLKKENKILCKKKNKAIEFDYNLLLKAYDKD